MIVSAHFLLFIVPFLRSETDLMFYTNGLLYIHIPRTGGTFVTSLLDRHAAGTRSLAPGVDGHCGVRDIPDVFQNTFSFATVRDPWSWYASIDKHYRNKSSFQGFLHAFYGSHAHFKEVLLGLCDPSRGSMQPNPSLGLPGASSLLPDLKRQIHDSGFGLWSFCVVHMLCRQQYETLPGASSVVDFSRVLWGVDAIVDTAQVREGLRRVVFAHDSSLHDKMLEDIQTSKRMNSSAGFAGVMPDGSPDRSMYDNEMVDAVLRHDGALMSFLGLDVPVGSPDRPSARLVERG